MIMFKINNKRIKEKIQL